MLKFLCLTPGFTPPSKGRLRQQMVLELWKIPVCRLQCVGWGAIMALRTVWAVLERYLDRAKADHGGKRVK